MLQQFELDGAAGFLLDDDSPTLDPPAARDIANLDFHDVAATQFTVDREVE
jgi:hypothetical protein